ncbi:hypothetical protein O181_119431 [Austropuccinia psidii MF-1]|uniref:Reverse transcriptase Ty1/copia-type domain-containing protein n=1 Tax=Austropuccinia psidii MF-1 TaxID=1389203 RepID=A0A9Q3KGG9_9BASI|nr:hypothetical protein [Austropuccinia psidii MF-1]
MYGLKQAGYCWWQHFCSVMQKIGFEAEELDQCIYKCSRNGAIIYVWMHVDDGVIFSTSNNEITKLKADLMQHLKLQWEDNVSRIVGIDLSYSQDNIVLSQSRFAHQVIDQFERKANLTLILNKTSLPEYKLETSNDSPIEQKWYQSIIGSLNYLALGTRPDISFAVNYLAQYSISPQEQHWQALHYLLGYIKHSMNRTLSYKITGDGLDVWTDADWGGEFQRSTTGFVFKLFGCTITWGSRRQKLVATSTCAEELVAMGMLVNLLSFILQILKSGTVDILARLICDNKAAVMVIKGSKTRIKSLERHFYSINDLIQKYGIKIEWISTTNQLADICTKHLGPIKLLSNCRKLLYGD